MTIIVLEDLFEEKMKETNGLLDEGALDLAGNFLGQIAKNNLKKIMATGKVKLSMPSIDLFHKLKKMGVKNVGPYKIDQVIRQMERQLGIKKNYAGKYHLTDHDDDVAYGQPPRMDGFLKQHIPPGAAGGFYDPTGQYRIPTVTKGGKTIFKTVKTDKMPDYAKGDNKKPKKKGSLGSYINLSKMFGINENTTLSLKEIFYSE